MKTKRKPLPSKFGLEKQRTPKRAPASKSKPDRPEYKGDKGD